MGFNLVNLAITVRSDDVSFLKRRLPLLAAEYAASCRNLSCHWPLRACGTCSAQEKCAWYLVFGQKLASDPAALKRYQKPPLPFAFSFPQLDGSSELNAEIVCGLVVIGHAIPHLEMLLDGFADLLSVCVSPVSAEIAQVACRDYQGSIVANGCIRSRNLVPHNLLIASSEGLVESRTWGNSELHIRLLSSLRLHEHGRSVVRFDFCRFARSVLRRVSALAYYYGESEFCCDFKELSRQVEDVICTDDHFCYRNDKNRKLSGMIGYGSFSGDFSQLVPFIAIASYVHTGKGSSFGMGDFEILPEVSRKVV